VTEHRAQVDELLADYRRGRDQLASVHRDLASISESACDDAGLVTATVGPRGTLTGLKIADEAYQKYRPGELADEIVRVTAAATVKAITGAGELLAPVLPDGTDPQALLLGTGDLRAGEITPRRAPAEDRDDDEASFEEKSWVEEQQWPTAR
jgi:hypothetical protein